MKPYEDKIDELLVRLADEGSIVARTETDGLEPTEVDGIKRFRFGPAHRVDQVEYAALERLAARELAERVVDKHYGPEGLKVIERFVPTPAGESYAMVLRGREEVLA